MVERQPFGDNVDVLVCCNSRLVRIHLMLPTPFSSGLEFVKCYVKDTLITTRSSAFDMNEEIQFVRTISDVSKFRL